MNNKLIRAWHHDLTSGGFKQGKNRLEYIDDDGKTCLCCLGVLCRTAMRLGLELEAKIKVSGDGKPFKVTTFGKNKIEEILPLEVSRFLYGDDYVNPNNDVSMRNPFLHHGEANTDHATQLNDVENWGFGQIAEAVKGTWPEAFIEE